jgi:N-acetyl-gamma-glutamyl-phosphate reductase
MNRVHVIGAAGYAGAETVRLLRRHPHFSLETIESNSGAGEPLADTFAFWRDDDRRFDEPGTGLATLQPGDAVILAGRSGEARETAPKVLAAGARAIDLSDDFRLAEHAGAAVYGFTERYRAAIAHAQLVANPGCYPTSTLLALTPLAPFAGEIVQIVIDAKSGITGAGRNPATASLFAEVDENVRPYGLQGHRHEREIGQELAAAGIAAPFLFTPHVVPLRRGMLTDAYAIFASAPPADAIHAAFRRAYGGSPFVRVLPEERAPSMAAVAYTNDAELNVSVKGNVVRVLSAIDNLGKGAAGQAIQNLNVMYGLPEETALDDLAIAR